MNDLKVFLECWQTTHGDHAPQAVADKVAEVLDLLDELDGPRIPSPIEQLLEMELAFLRHPANATRFTCGNPRKESQE